MYTRIHMHWYIYMCVGVHALCIAKRIHRHEPRRFMWVYADHAHTVCACLHPQRIRDYAQRRCLRILVSKYDADSCGVEIHEGVSMDL